MNSLVDPRAATTAVRDSEGDARYWNLGAFEALPYGCPTQRKDSAINTSQMSHLGREIVQELVEAGIIPKGP